jgi:hypothetical protein
LAPVIVIVVVAVGLGVGLPLAFRGSSTATTTPPAGASGAVTDVGGGYYTTTVQNSRLVYLKLKKTAAGYTGFIAVAGANTARSAVSNKRYKVTATVSESNVSMTVTPAVDGQTTLTATFVSGTVSVTIGAGETYTLKKGKYAAFRSLITKETSTLLS